MNMRHHFCAGRSFGLLCIILAVAVAAVFSRDLLAFKNHKRTIVPFFEWVFALVSPPEGYYDPLAVLPLRERAVSASVSHFYRGQYAVFLVFSDKDADDLLEPFGLQVKIALQHGNKSVTRNATAKDDLLRFRSDKYGTEVVLLKYAIPEAFPLDEGVLISVSCEGNLEMFLRSHPGAHISVGKLSDE